jgi:hypothetical protein
VVEALGRGRGSLAGKSGRVERDHHRRAMTSQWAAVGAEEQAALRRVATLVAQAAPPAEIFSAVSNEVATLFRTEMVVVGRFDGDPADLPRGRRRRWHR